MEALDGSIAMTGSAARWRDPSADVACAQVVTFGPARGGFDEVQWW
jgi:hypothetical protein